MDGILTALGIVGFVISLALWVNAMRECWVSRRLVWLLLVVLLPGGMILWYAVGSGRLLRSRRR